MKDSNPRLKIVLARGPLELGEGQLTPQACRGGGGGVSDPRDSESTGPVAG